MINTCTLAGKVSKGHRVTPCSNGSTLLTFQVRQSYKKGDKFISSYFSVKVWDCPDALARVIEEGHLVVVSGILATDTFKDKTTGANRTTMHVVCQPENVSAYRIERIGNDDYITETLWAGSANSIAVTGKLVSVDNTGDPLEFSILTNAGRMNVSMDNPPSWTVGNAAEGNYAMVCGSITDGAITADTRLTKIYPISGEASEPEEELGEPLDYDDSSILNPTG